MKSRLCSQPYEDAYCVELFNCIFPNCDTPLPQIVRLDITYPSNEVDYSLITSKLAKLFPNVHNIHFNSARHLYKQKISEHIDIGLHTATTHT